MSTNKATGPKHTPGDLDDYIQEYFERREMAGHEMSPVEIELAMLNEPLFNSDDSPSLSRLIGRRDAEAPSDDMGLLKYGLGGYDTVEGGIYGEWNEVGYRVLLGQLEEAKQLAKDDNPATVILGGIEWIVRPQGFRAGVFYQYVLEAHGVMIALPEKVNKQYAAVRYRLGFHVLIGRDMYAVFAELLSMLKDEGFRYVKDTVSRVDFQVDMVGREVREYTQLCLSDHAVARARSWTTNGRPGAIETLTAGKQVQICVYDKVKELLSKGDVVKCDLMRQYRFGGEWPEACTRIEFRVRRDPLRLLKINSIDDLRRKEQSLLHFLHTDWFRILDRPKVRGHENEQLIHPIWQEVRAAFAESFNQTREDEVCRDWSNRRSVKCDAEKLKKQASGCLASIVALTGKTADLPTAVLSIMQFLNDARQAIFDRAIERARQFGTAHGVHLEPCHCPNDAELIEQIRNRLNVLPEAG